MYVYGTGRMLIISIAAVYVEFDRSYLLEHMYILFYINNVKTQNFTQNMNCFT